MKESTAGTIKLICDLHKLSIRKYVLIEILLCNYVPVFASFVYTGASELAYRNLSETRVKKDDYIDRQGLEHIFF